MSCSILEPLQKKRKMNKPIDIYNYNNFSYHNCFYHWDNLKNAIIIYNNFKIQLGNFIGSGKEGFVYNIQNMKNSVIKIFYDVTGSDIKTLYEIKHSNNKYFSKIKDVIYDIVIPCTENYCSKCKKIKYSYQNSNDIYCKFKMCIITEKCYSLKENINITTKYLSKFKSLEEIYKLFIKMCYSYPEKNIKYLDFKIAPKSGNVLLRNINNNIDLCIIDYGNIDLNIFEKHEDSETYKCPIYFMYPSKKYYLSLDQIIKYTSIISIIQILLIIYNDFYTKTTTKIKEQIENCDYYWNIYLYKDNSDEYHIYFKKLINTYLEYNIIDLNQTQINLWKENSSIFYKYLENPTLIP